MLGIAESTLKQDFENNENFQQLSEIEDKFKTSKDELLAAAEIKEQLHKTQEDVTQEFEDEMKEKEGMNFIDGIKSKIEVVENSAKKVIGEEKVDKVKEKVEPKIEEALKPIEGVMGKLGIDIGQKDIANQQSGDIKIEEAEVRTPETKLETQSNQDPQEIVKEMGDEDSKENEKKIDAVANAEEIKDETRKDPEGMESVEVEVTKNENADSVKETYEEKNEIDSESKEKETKKEKEDDF